jgi:hypothetical protein
MVSLPAFMQEERADSCEFRGAVSGLKARAQLGCAPRYEPEDAVLESVRWLIDHGQLEVVSPLKV